MRVGVEPALSQPGNMAARFAAAAETASPPVRCD
jgi:hypothetical protein